MGKSHRGARRQSERGGRPLTPDRQDTAAGGSPDVPPSVHLRHPQQQASPARGDSPGEDSRRARLYVPQGVTSARREGTTAPAGDGRGPSADRSAILRTEGLTMRFGGLAALNQVSLSIPRGE